MSETKPAALPGAARRLRIAVLGTRGVPPAYGGFETFAGELSVRLVARGHEVAVYCRPAAASTAMPHASSESGEVWRGVRRIVVPAVMGSKYFETVSHSFFSSLDALRRDFDVVLVCNAANAFVLPLLRCARMPVAINVDGIERRRRKWNFLGRAVYALGEAFSVTFASRLIADAEVIARYYRAQHLIEPVTIPYGAEFPSENDSGILEGLGLVPRGYILYVSRFEPENNPLEVVRAYCRLRDDLRLAADRDPAIPASGGAEGYLPPLVMLGSASYAHDLAQELRSYGSDTVLFPGALYGEDYRTLQRHALIYVQATEVGGTHPALIEAMASGGCVLANDTPENREVGEEAIGYFRLGVAETLSSQLRVTLQSEQLREERRLLARRRAGERFGWEQVTDAYEELFFDLL